MKNNFNPYTVPDDFFEKACSDAVATHKKHKRALRGGMIATMAAVLIIAVPLFTYSLRSNDMAASDCSTDNLAELYENDIFLQVNF